MGILYQRVWRWQLLLFAFQDGFSLDGNRAARWRVTQAETPLPPLQEQHVLVKV